MNLLLVIGLFSAGAVVVLVAAVLAVAFIRSRRIPAISPAPPFQCPTCKGEQIDVRTSGIWDGEKTLGGMRYGVCHQCGGRCAQYDRWDPDTLKHHYDASYVPSDEEWRQQVEPSPEHQRILELQAQWPFLPEHNTASGQNPSGRA